MINLRFHIVSLVAVFVALALGVVAGTTVIDQQLIEDLERQRADDRRKLEEAREEIAVLDARLDVWAAVGEAIVEPLMRDRLVGRAAVLVAGPGATDALVDPVADALTDAGARVTGRITLTERVRLPDDAARRELGLALAAVDDSDRRALLEAAGERLGTRLRAPGTTGERDLLATLERDGFLVVTDAPSGAFPATGALVVVVSDGTGEDVPAAFWLSLVRALAPGPTAVAEPLGSRDGITGRITADGDLRARVATVDHANTTPGLYALVVALEEVAAGRPAPHYGTGRRTSGVVPS